MQQLDDEFYQVRYRPDSWKPDIRRRCLKMVKTGTWFFGLLGIYKLVYTDWEDKHGRS